MVIERTENEIVIRLSGMLDIGAMQKTIDYFNAMEIIARNQGTEAQAAELARQVEADWWQANKSRFLP